MPSLKVTIVDLGGTRRSCWMVALPMTMSLSQEEVHHWMKPHKMDATHSLAAEEYDRDSRASDQSASVMALAEKTAKQFEEW